MHRGVEQIVRARADRAAGGGDGADDRGIVEPARVAVVRMVDQEGDGRPRAVRGARRHPGRAIGGGDHLAPPDDLELRRNVRGGDGVKHAAAGAAGVQAEHEARPLWRATPEIGPQAEAAVIAVDVGELAPGEMDRGIPDQRAVGEDGEILARRMALQRGVAACPQLLLAEGVDGRRRAQDELLHPPVADLLAGEQRRRVRRRERRPGRVAPARPRARRPGRRGSP